MQRWISQGIKRFLWPPKKGNIHPQAFWHPLHCFQVYIRGQEEDHEYDSHDYEFCGKSIPTRVKTPGPRLVLLFNAGTRPGSGFKAKFRFETGMFHVVVEITIPKSRWHSFSERDSSWSWNVSVNTNKLSISLCFCHSCRIPDPSGNTCTGRELQIYISKSVQARGAV